MTVEEDFLAPWLEEIRQMYDAAKPCKCTDETENGQQPKPPILDSRPHEGFFEKRIGRIAGGPPPRGKPKPPVESAPAVSGEAAAAIHRAMTISGKV